MNGEDKTTSDDAFERETPTVLIPQMPVRLTSPDTSDRRLISEMRFGVNYSPAETLRDENGNVISKEWKPTPEQEQEQEWVRKYLAWCGCERACDIEKLGCTGVAENETAMGRAEDKLINAIVANGTRLRLGLGGCGVGLPCFVPDDRFCLVHNTVGGLQQFQKPLHPEFIDVVSRELTAAERIQVGLTEKARRMRGGERTVDALGVLTGDNEEAIAEVAQRLEDQHDEKILEKSELDDSGPVPFVPLGAQTWKCDEHEKTNWACRHCLAQAIVEGPLEPVFLTTSLFDDNPDGDTQVQNPVQLRQWLSREDVRSVQIFARVATFTRKLSRD